LQEQKLISLNILATSVEEPSIFISEPKGTAARALIQELDRPTRVQDPLNHCVNFEKAA
jgi:hypothetical protein